MEETAARMDTLQAIELAEGVEVRLRIAGPVLRGGAFLLDFFFEIVIVLAGSWILALTGIAFGSQVSEGLWLLGMFAVMWWYPVCFEASKWGATPGKKIVGLRVVQYSGSPVTFAQALLRNFLRCADHMPYFGLGIMGFPSGAFALATMLATKRFQRLGDLAAGTVVVYDRIPPEPVVPAPPPMESLQPTAALRPDEIRALQAFRDRAGLWSEGRRQEIADHARELSGKEGAAGVSRLMSMAHWLEERR